jgi:hypothetical protein
VQWPELTLRRGPLVLLTRHFFDRFLDAESLSPGAEPQTNAVQILGFVAVPSGLFTILCLPMVLTGWTLVAVRNFFVSFSMIVMALVVVFEWDALFPDRRDYQVLTPLPLKLWTFFLAKVLALGLLAGVFLVAANFFGVLLWPSADGSGGGLLEVVFAHVAAIFAAGLWGALAVASLRGVLVTLFSGAWLRRVSVAVQTLLMAVLVMLLVVGPWIGPLLRGFVFTESPLLYAYPGFWFLGLYERLRPATGDPELVRLGGVALWALGAAAALFVVTYLPLYRRHARRTLETPAPQPEGPGWLRRWASTLLDHGVLRRPQEQAVFHFISQAITRSPKHRLFLATYAGFGAALAVLSYTPGETSLLRLPLTLSFVLVSALRAAFNVPAELGANWAVQLAETAAPAPHVAATRKWILVCGVLPLFALLGPLEFARFSWRAAAFHAAYGIVLSALLIEVLFFGFRKVPFTCGYFLGRINLVWLSVVYTLGFMAYSRVMAGVESWLAHRPAAAVTFLTVVLAVRRLLRHLSARAVRRSPELDYEGSGDPVVRTLGLAAE